MTSPAVDRRPTVAATAVLVVGGAALGLHRMGRVWWCACGSWAPWSGDVWSSHNSQHLLDPYSFTHVLHGFAFAGATWLVLRRWPAEARWLVAVTFEAGWELVENSPLIIDRYRAATISLDYYGDSVWNSIGDISCCALGFLLAHRIGWRASVAVFLLVELMLVAWIRDSLLLNILMLVWPIQALKDWQAAVHG